MRLAVIHLDRNQKIGGSSPPSPASVNFFNDGSLLSFMGRMQNWRQSTKQRIIDAMGDHCCICGYDRCKRNLVLHHLDPTMKETTISNMLKTPRKWDLIVSELRKCVMVCQNCHGEIHDGITQVPLNAQRFNEEYADYHQKQRMENYDQCPICGKPKPVCQITCSISCAGKRRMKIEWDTIDLESLLKSKSIMAVARELGCSDMAVRKRIKKLKSPKKQELDKSKVLKIYQETGSLTKTALYFGRNRYTITRIISQKLANSG